MPYRPLISKIRCHNPNRKRSRVANRNYLTYIATREGVDLTNVNDINDLMNLSDKVMESELNEDYVYKEADNDKYIRYMAKRPRSHGLFGNIDTTDLNKIASEVANLTKLGKNIYRGIISLSEKDAEALGFTNKEQWYLYLKRVIPDIARELNISTTNHTWVAAFHAEKTHPHVHFELWDNTNKVRSSFIHTSVQNKCRSILSDAMFNEEYENTIKEIFKLEREELNSIRNKSRSEITNTVKDIMNSLDNMFVPGVKLEKLPSRIKIDDLKILSKELIELIETLPSKGSIDYAYLPKDVKEKVDNIVGILFERADLKKELFEYIEAVGEGQKLLGKTKFEIDIAKDKASKDLHKRVANIILKKVKDLNLSYNAAESYITKEIEQPFNFDSNNNSNISFVNITDYSLNYNFDDFTDDYTDDKDDNYKYALSYLKQSADQGFAYAAYEVGKMYDRGIGTNINVDLSYKYYRQAFIGFLKISNEREDDNLMYRIGKMYYYGIGTESDENKAIEYLERSAKLNNSYAQYLLSSIYIKSGDLSKTEDAIQWLQKAASSNNNMAQYTLGKLYLEGNYVVNNIENAINLLKKSADQENQFAQYQLGKLYYEGIEVNKDLNLSIAYLSSSAEQNNEFAQYTLGKIYADQNSGYYDINKAIHFYTKSAEQGNQFAQYQLGKLYLWGKHVDKNENLGLYWMNKAINQGNEYAAKTLEMYENFKNNSVTNIAYGMIRFIYNMIGNQKYNTISLNNDKAFRSKSKQAKKEAALRNKIPGNTAEVEEG